MKLIVTIDVEEDNWGHFHPTEFTLDNLRGIPELQRLFDQYQVIPTYLVNFPVANDPFAVELFGRLHAAGKCEIGMHCHPWNTPPFVETTGEFNSMLCNLPDALALDKLSSLKQAIVRNIGVAPVSFRAGRWAMGCGVARALTELDVKIDTSVTPYTDWSCWQGVNYDAMSPALYRFSCAEVFKEDRQGGLLEVPVTIGYLQRDFARCNQYYRSIEKGFSQVLRIKGLLARLGLLNRVIMSPEVSDDGNMIALARAMRNYGYPLVNMFFHSTSLIPGLSPFVRDNHQKSRFFRTLDNFFNAILKHSFVSVPLKEALIWNAPQISPIKSYVDRDEGLNSAATGCRTVCNAGDA